jgi:hypothetical protein
MAILCSLMSIKGSKHTMRKAMHQYSYQNISLHNMYYVHWRKNQRKKKKKPTDLTKKRSSNLLKFASITSLVEHFAGEYSRNCIGWLHPFLSYVRGHLA